jgi:amino acid adenylation domain-containing protein
MSVNEVVELLHKAMLSGVAVLLDEDEIRLKVSGNIVVDESLIKDIRDNKGAIINFIKSNNGLVTPEERRERISVRNRDGKPAPLSFGQESLWVIDQLEGSTAYHIPFALRLQGKLHYEALAGSFHRVTDRHEILRTVIEERDGGLYQRIIENDFRELEMIEAKGYDQESLDRLVEKLIGLPFDLRRDRMVRPQLIKLGDNEHILVVTMHHIASDGWSMPIMIKEVSKWYAGLLSGRETPLEEMSLQYSDFALWQRQELAGPGMDGLLRYWKKKLDGVNLLDLPTDHVRPSRRSGKGAAIQYTIGNGLKTSLVDLSKQEGVTVFMTLLAAFKVLLHRYSGQDDICVGSAISNRTRQELEGAIGYISNTVALRSDLGGNPSFRELLSRVRETALGAYDHQEVPFEKVVEAVAKERRIGINPLFQVMFDLQNIREDEMAEGGLTGIKISPFPILHRTAKFDLTFTVVDTAAEWWGNVEYNTELYSRETIDQMIDQYIVLLNSIVGNPEHKIGDLSMISEEASTKILKGFAARQVIAPGDKTVLDVFGDQVELCQNRNALIDKRRQWSFKDLDMHSDRLKQSLVESGVGEGSRVAICMSRSFEMISGLLGILKAGALYVPLDPSYPADRGRYILEDSLCGWILIDKDSPKWLDVLDNVVKVDVDRSGEAAAKRPLGKNKKRISAGSPAYIMYTSGSTGTPKGVMISHGNLINYLINDQTRYLDEGAETRGTYLHLSFAFDASLTGIFMPLLFGKAIVIGDVNTSNVFEDRSFFRFAPYDFLKLTPAHIPLLVDAMEKMREIPVIRRLVLGGEALQRRHLTNLPEQFNDSEIINEYGPTEATVGCSTFRLRLGDALSPGTKNNIPIGKPIDNVTMYIVDGEIGLCPTGVVGEIAIGGAGLSSGYVNLPTLTEKKFIPDKYGKNSQGRLYMTGDLGRWLVNGNIEYCGRKDEQIKLRGYRIEPGEIEEVLSRSPLVDKCAVVLRKGDSEKGEGQLVAYIAGKGEWDSESLIIHLRKFLPEYMLPSLLVPVEDLPLTNHGKVDRSRLAKLSSTHSIDTEFVAPQSETEQRIAGIWGELLGIARIGRNDDFFLLGGDSITIINVVSKIRHVFNKEVKLADIYETGTLQGMSALVDKAPPVVKDHGVYEHINREFADLKDEILAKMTGAENVEDIYPMSDIQSGMIYASLAEPELDIYHDQFVFLLKTGLDINVLEKGLSLLVEKHEILRTAFSYDLYPEGVQIVYRRIPVKIGHIELSHLNEKDGNAFIKEYVGRQKCIPFDFSLAPLWRYTLISHKNQTTCLFEFHHAVLDGWSTSSLSAELNNLYLQLIRDPAEISVTRLKCSYKDFIVESIAEKRSIDNGTFWQQEMSEYKRVDIFSQGSVDEKLSRSYGPEYLKDISQCIKRDKLSFRAVFIGAYLYSIGLLCYDDDLTIGLVTNTRPLREDGEKVLGCFLNTIPFRFNVGNTGVTWRSFFTAIEQKLKDLKRVERTPLIEIAKAAKEPTTRGNPFFDVFFNFTNFHVYDRLQDGLGTTAETSFFEEEALGSWSTNTFLDCTASITAGGLEVSFYLRKNLSSGRSLQDLSDWFDRALGYYMNSPDEVIKKDSILTGGEIWQLTKGFNRTKRNYPADKSIVALFEDQAEKTPDHIALEFGHRKMSYRELNIRANQVCNYLIGSGIQPGSMVPMCVERGIDMIVGILGILKAGAAYVPLDPAFPTERLRIILRDTDARIALASKSTAGTLENIAGIKIIEVDGHADRIDQKGKDNPGISAGLETLAYVMYTSGSTGRPKGVLMQTHVLVNLLLWQNRHWGGKEPNRVLQFSSINFDVSFQEIFSALCFGGCVVLIDEPMRRDMEGLLQCMARHKVDHLFMPYVVLNNLCESANRLCLYPTDLKVIFCAGEQLKLNDDIILFLDKTHSRLLNHYGPTETHIVSFYEVDVFDQERHPLPPIGKPIDNSRIYITDANGNLSPIGVPGELRIGGTGLAKGYLNLPDQTASKFVKDFFSGDDDSRLYLSGDIGRWLPDGNIEFMGRRDDQVKIRGYRVEPAEVEAMLKDCESVKQCAVLPKRDTKTGDQYLVAYVAVEGEFDRKELLSYLKDRLPSYMVPRILMEVKSFPVTINGKLDRSKLPEPIIENTTTDSYVPPRNALEKAIAGIWSNLLPVNQLGVHDNVFDLGAHSLMITRVFSMARKELGVDIKVRDIFENPTVEMLAECIGKAFGNSLDATLGKGPRPVLMPLSFGQERIWIIDRMEGSIQYHIPVVLQLRGELDEEVLEDCFREVVNRHEVLRTVFRQIEEDVFQEVLPAGAWRLERIDAGGGGEDTIREQVQRLIQMPFDLSKDHLLRAHILSLGEKDRVLVATVHHIASDGWSMPILIGELKELYGAAMAKRTARLDEPALQYGDYAIWQRERLKGEAFEQKLQYWEHRLKGAMALDMPTDHPRIGERSIRGEALRFGIEKGLSVQLQELSQRHGVTLFMSMLSAFQVLLYRYSGQEDICVGSAIANRLRPEISGSIGYFANTLVFRGDLGGEPTFRELLGRTRAMALEAYEHQEVPIEQVVEALVKERNTGRNPLFQVMFDLQNKIEDGVEGEWRSGLEVSAYSVEHITTKFELTFTLAEGEGGLWGGVEYCTDLYEKETVQRMVGHFRELLKSIVKSPDQRIGELGMLTQTEQEELLEKFNKKVGEYPRGGTVMELIEEQVRKDAEKTAIIWKGGQLSYREMNERANRIGYMLRRRGVNAGDRVGICMEGGMEMVLGILGILKAGGCYVPLDVSYPPHRLSYIVEDSGSRLLLVDEGRRGITGGWTRAVEEFCIGDEKGEADDEFFENTGIGRGWEDPAYMMYTSGSTGRPKGVLIEHGPLLNYIVNRSTEYVGEETGTSGTYIHLSYSFDASVTGLFMPLVKGKAIVISSGRQTNVFRDRLFVENMPYDFIKLTPAHMGLLEVALEEIGSGKIARRLVLGGEKLEWHHIGYLADKGLSMEIINEYGPTEATVGCSTYRMDSMVGRSAEVIPIGKPIDNVRMYILDSANKLCPVGVVGEIAIGGLGLSRGYPGEPEQTGEKFIEDPYSEGKGRRMYRTGDLGRWRSDGNLEYVGRRDEQVKIRGYRIETGEIEGVLRESGLVKGCAVVCGGEKPLEGGKKLIGYIVAKGEYDADAIGAYLRKRLPEYMLPSILIELGELPLTSRGKVDRRKLPDPEAGMPEAEGYVASRTETERKIADIWQELLGIERIGIHDDFFKMGGHSLLAIRFLSILKKETEIDLPIGDFFHLANIESLSKYLTTEKNNSLTEDESYAAFKL